MDKIKKITLLTGEEVNMLSHDELNAMDAESIRKEIIDLKIKMRRNDLEILKRAKATRIKAQAHLKSILRFVKSRIRHKRLIESNIRYRFYYYFRRFINIYDTMIIWRDTRRAKRDFYETKEIIWDCTRSINEVNRAGEEIYGLPSEDYHS